MTTTPNFTAMFLHDVPRAIFDSLPGTEERKQLDPKVNEYYWAKTVKLGACLLHVFCDEPPVPPVCYICHAPLEMEHATLCNDCAQIEAQRWQDYVAASNDERPS